MDSAHLENAATDLAASSAMAEHLDHARGETDAPLIYDPARLNYSRMFDLAQLEVSWEEEIGTLWAHVTPHDRPNYNLALLRDAMVWLDESRRLFGGKDSPLRFMVLGSRFPGVWNLGGDLEYFVDCIKHGDRERLRDYGHRCTRIVDRLWHGNDLPIVNIGLAQGDALGGGLEALLCHDVIIAERDARFGLPEVVFGLFPGMGAYSILCRKLGHAEAHKMIQSGKIYSAQEMYDMGLITLLADNGEGEEVARDYIASNLSRHAGMVGALRSARRVQPLEQEELNEIVDIWADSALHLATKDLRLMRRLAAAQSRLSTE